MSKIESYRHVLRELADWEGFLLAESRLPGPRANLELAFAVVSEGDESCFRRLASFDACKAPTNTPEEFLAVCGVMGLSSMVGPDRLDLLAEARIFASDERWRIRETVALGLQRAGSEDVHALMDWLDPWIEGNPLEQRALVATLCEPGLLRDPACVRRLFDILDRVTAGLAASQERRSDPVKVLRKGLGYGWSLAVAALPEEGRRRMAAWFASKSPDVRWVMIQNLRKKRLQRIDPDWAASQLSSLSGKG